MFGHLKLALLTLSLVETVTRKQKNKQKHVCLGSISKITKFTGTDWCKSEDVTVALVQWCISLKNNKKKQKKRKRCKKPAVNQHVKRLVDVALRPNDSDSLLAEVCRVDNCDSKMAYHKLKLLKGIALFAQLPGTHSQIFQLKTSSRFSIVFEGLFYCSSVWRRSGLMVSALVSGSSGAGSSPGPGHCVVFLSKTLHSHSASLYPGV